VSLVPGVLEELEKLTVADHVSIDLKGRNVLGMRFELVVPSENPALARKA
jgi:hypothetical protein